MLLDFQALANHVDPMDGFFFGASLMMAALLALIIDALFGEPKVLWARIGHPVVWLGNFAARLERQFNKGQSRVQRGAFTWLRVVSFATLVGLLIQLICLALPYGWVLLGLIGSVGLAARSLDQHVRAVAGGLDQGLEEGRAAVSQIVGRDPESLDEAGVARAAIESLAENSSDGFVAPLFWFVLLGLPGLFAYKAINTLDSMWGHRNERFEEFGKVAARIDDVANWLPARLTAFWVSLATGTFLPLAAAFRDGPKHRSVNAGWPEAAYASALKLSLAGPRVYGGEVTRDAPMGAGTRQAKPQHIRAALKLHWYVWGIVFVGCSGALALQVLR